MITKKGKPLLYTKDAMIEFADLRLKDLQAKINYLQKRDLKNDAKIADLEHRLIVAKVVFQEVLVKHVVLVELRDVYRKKFNSV